MTDKVNGGVRAGEFLTGNMDFFSIATLVPVAQTNVVTPVADLYVQQGYSVWQSVVVTDGSGTAVTYSTQASYEDALAKQSNLDLMLRVFAQRVNPVAISLSTLTGVNPSTTTAFSGFSGGGVFGDDYTSTALTITTIKIATEKSGQWNVSSAAESNDNGYQLLTALNGLTVLDVAAGTIAPDTINVDADGVSSGTTGRNTIAIRALVL